MRIGITTRIVAAQGYSEDRDALAQGWGVFIAAALPGALWMPIPNLGADQVVAHCEGWGIDRLIISGGDDIGVCPLRDRTETGLLDWAASRNIAVLGVCRGMQLMASLAGIALQPIVGHVATRHALCGERLDEVNSFHGLALAECPQGYDVIARAPDGCIEAIAHQSLKWQGWMWHPEREMPLSPTDVEQLRKLFA